MRYNGHCGDLQGEKLMSKGQNGFKKPYKFLKTLLKVHGGIISIYSKITVTLNFRFRMLQLAVFYLPNLLFTNGGFDVHSRKKTTESDILHKLSY